MCRGLPNLIGGIILDKNRMENEYRFGLLPQEAPLASAYVPMQKSAMPEYEPGEALARGTLFPGLDLPFMNMINKSFKSTPLTELMAIDFVTDELELYLDTHANDSEAFELYQTFLALKKEAHLRYTDLCGPVKQSDMQGMRSYSWLNDPWPWDYQPKMEV